MKYLKNEILVIKREVYLGSCSLRKQSKRDSSDEGEASLSLFLDSLICNLKDAAFSRKPDTFIDDAFHSV